MAHRHEWFDVTTVGCTGEVRKCWECGKEQVRPFGTDKWETRDAQVLPLATYRVSQ